jgi:hypothetical protein
MAVEHGNNTVVVQGNIIHVTLKGSFNELGAKDVSEKTTEAINTINQETFLILVNLLNLEGGTPEAFSISNEFNEWLNKQNMVAKAIVISSQTIKDIDQQRVPSKATQNIKYFATESDALVWLKSLN